jgi:hypothetical protein
MNNLDIYNKVRVVPPTAKKDIQAGRLKGMTDINPMWRIKVLTETFGLCGIGWKYDIVEERLEDAKVDNVIAAFVRINLYVKVDGAWSDAIPGTGGSSFVAKETKGPYVSDECFKMALTDALSVACKALGVGADVYWDKDKTKYTGNNSTDQLTPVKPVKLITPKEGEALVTLALQKGTDLTKLMAYYKVTELGDMTVEQYKQATEALNKKEDAHG